MKENCVNLFYRYDRFTSWSFTFPDASFGLTRSKIEHWIFTLNRTRDHHNDFLAWEMVRDAVSHVGCVASRCAASADRLLTGVIDTSAASDWRLVNGDRPPVHPPALFFRYLRSPRHGDAPWDSLTTLPRRIMNAFRSMETNAATQHVRLSCPFISTASLMISFAHRNLIIPRLAAVSFSKNLGVTFFNCITF